MALNNDFGLHVALHVKKSNPLLAKEVQDALDNTNRKFHVDIKKVNVTNAVLGELQTRIQTYFDSDSRAFRLKVNRIDAKEAIANVRQELAQMVEAFRLDNGVNIKGIGSFTDGAYQAKADAAARAAEAAKEEAAAGQQVLENAIATEQQKRAQQKVLQDIASIEGQIGTFQNGNVFASKDTGGIITQWEEVKQKLLDVKKSVTEENAANTAAIDQQITKIEEIKTSLAQLIAQIKSMPTIGASDTVYASAKQIDTLTSQINNKITAVTNIIDSNTRMWGSSVDDDFRSARDSLEGLLIRMGSMTNMTEEQRIAFQQEFAEINSGIATANKNLTSMGLKGQTVLKRFSNGLEKFGGWAIVTRSLTAAIRLGKQVVTNVNEIDSAMTQLRIVTKATDGQMSRFASTASTLAQELGKGIPELLKTIETYSRLGYSLDESTSLAKYTAILSNVANVDSETATTGLTSIIKGFNLKVEDAEHVSDVLISVGQEYAVSAEELMEAYEKAGAALSATNTSFEKSAALIAAANASVQDASVVGTALKTVSARIRGSKSELEELGETTEDLAEGFSKYADEIKALTGFDIMIDDTHFKDLYDIMDGLSSKWGQLSDTTQARVAEILGGTRQLQVISSIIGNWKDAAGAYETAINSVGEAISANSKYMESGKAHLEQLNAAFQEFSTTFLDSGFLKYIIDTVKTLVQGVTALTNAVGGLGTTLTAAGIFKAIKSIS